MERLTSDYMKENGVIMYELKNGIVNQKLIDALAEYELLGLTPEEIKKRLLNEEELAYICASMSLLQEYLDKKHSGRLFEMPCKIGDTIWFADTECKGCECLEYEDNCDISCEKLKKPIIKNSVIKEIKIKGNGFDSIQDTDGNVFLLTDINKKFFIGENAKEVLERSLYE